MSQALKDKRNIAILAHVDAGKTTVSERLLYFSDAIPGMGEVDEGLATMDYLEEEKKRGITIEAGIASYSWKGIRTTFVDTPGHVDFGVEVDFALQSVEGVVLVISGPRGLESQTLEAWEKIRLNRNLPLLFINKLDIAGSEYVRVLDQIKILFKVEPVVLNFPIFFEDKIDGVVDVVHQLALFRSMENPRKLLKGEIPAAQQEEYLRFRRELVDFASQFNDTVLEAYLAGKEIEPQDLMAGVRGGFQQGKGVPIYMGSALKNVGIRQLLNGINQLLPMPTIPEDADETLGFVLKVRWYQGIGKIALVKIFSEQTPKRLLDSRFYRVFAEQLEEIQEIQVGDILAVQTASLFSIGQTLRRGKHHMAKRQMGYKPLLQARIEVANEADHAKLKHVFSQLADMDPSIHTEPDLTTGGWTIHAVGELQLDVFCKRLKGEHLCDIKMGAPTVRYLEKLKRPIDSLTNEAQGYGCSAKIILDITINPKNEENLIEIPIGLEAVEKEVIQDCFTSFCSQGVCGYGEISGIFLKIKELQGSIRPIPPPLLSKVFADCLRLNIQGTQFEIFEPIMKLEIIAPEEYCGAILADLASRDGVVKKIDADGRNSIILLEIPLESTFGYTTLLRSLTKGLGVFVLTYEKHGVKKRN